jgi:hypothetical protein
MFFTVTDAWREGALAVQIYSVPTAAQSGRQQC